MKAYQKENEAAVSALARAKHAAAARETDLAHEVNRLNGEVARLRLEAERTATGTACQMLLATLSNPGFLSHMASYDVASNIRHSIGHVIGLPGIARHVIGCRLTTEQHQLTLRLLLGFELPLCACSLDRRDVWFDTSCTRLLSST